MQVEIGEQASSEFNARDDVARDVPSGELALEGEMRQRPPRGRPHSLAVLNATPTFCTFFEGVVMKRADSPYRAAALQSDGGITRLDEASLSHMSRACRFNNSSGVVIRLLEDLLRRHMGSGERRDAGVH